MATATAHFDPIKDEEGNEIAPSGDYDKIAYYYPRREMGCYNSIMNRNLSTNDNLDGSYNKAMNSYLTATWYFHDDTYVVNMSTLAVAKFN